MKKRFNNWFKHLFVRYIPGTQQLAVIEAQRLSEYIVTNYNIYQQTIILEEIRLNVINHRELEIEKKNLELELEQKELKALENSLEKLRIE